MRRLTTVAVLVAALALLGLWGASAAVPMQLDPSFGGDGKVLTDVGGSFWEDEHFALVMQPDGKLVAPGKAFNPATGNFDAIVIRYNPDGSLDTSFDNDGMVLTDFFGARDEALALALQPDGKLVAAGFAQTPATGRDLALARYNPDGSPDPSFGGDGRVTTDFFGGTDQALGVVVQPDGKVVAGGFAKDPATGDLDFALARYNPDGSLDTTFGSNGLVTNDVFGTTDGAFKLALQPDGKLVAAGTALSPTTGYDFALVRYNPDGSLDPTFDGDGVATADFFGGTDVAFTLLLQPDGKPVVGGLAFSTITGHYDFALARYNPDGSLDTTFATFGKPGLVATDFLGDYDQILSLALQPDGKILAGGHAFNPATHFDFGLARYLPDGRLDTSFGINGRLTTDFFGGPDGIHGLVVQADGKVVAAGDALNPGTGGDDFALARYLVADPDWIAGVVADLPDSAFASINGHNVKPFVLLVLALIELDTAANDFSAALTKLLSLRSFVDGCPPKVDVDDWIVDCTAQLQVRTLIDQVIDKLDGP